MSEIKPKSWKPLAIYIWTVVPIIMFCFIMIFSGCATVFINGFAVDSSDNLYIGKERKIEVYDDTNLIRVIPADYNDYAFTIIDGNTIVLSADYTYYLDLQGNEIKKDEDTSMRHKLSRINRFTSESGNEYKKTNVLGYTGIIRNNNTVVYSMPAFDYIILILLVLSFLSMVIFIPTFLITNLIYLERNRNRK